MSQYILQIQGNLVTILPKMKNTKILHNKSKTDYEQNKLENDSLLVVMLSRGERNGFGRREKRPKKIGRREKESKKIGRRENQHKKGGRRM